MENNMEEAIVVYFENESPRHAEEVAIFADEEVYHACLPALEALASSHRMIVTESVVESWKVTENGE